jgi:hypothetical protein
MIIKRNLIIIVLAMLSFTSLGCEELKENAVIRLRDYFPDVEVVPSNSTIWHFETNASGIGEATARSVFKKFGQEWNNEKTKYGMLGSSVVSVAGPQLVIIGFREIEIHWVPGQIEATYFTRTP